MIGAKPPSKRHPEWAVLFKTVMSGGHPDEIVDGPTVVLVDPASSEARFLPSM